MTKALAAMALSLALLPCASRAAEIPEHVHREYLMGASSVNLASDPARIPLAGTDWFGHYRCPYVRVFVNGKGPFTFVFDTGSNVTTLSAKVTKLASVAIISHVPGHHAIARASELRVGDIAMRDYYAVVEDGDDLDGILGFNAFGHKYLTFDFARKELIVSSRPIALRSAFWLPYTLEKHLPMVSMSIDGRHLPTLLDTGDDAFGWEATSNDLAGLTFDRSPLPSGAVFNGQTGKMETTITSVDGVLRLGPVHAERPAVAINESLPLPDIGMDVMDQFVLEFDRVHQRVAFAPRFSGTAFEVPGKITPGFIVSFRQRERLVREVLNGMLPARSGMHDGDAIVRINDREGAQLSYKDWDTFVRERRPIAVVWSHNGQMFSKTFPVVELP
jgi:hypothetical protein